MAEELIQAHYPWFWGTFQTYDMEVKKADAARVFILHRLGGLYLDLDVQCFRAVDAMLLDLDFAIQGCAPAGLLTTGVVLACMQQSQLLATAMPLWLGTQPSLRRIA